MNRRAFHEQLLAELLLPISDLLADANVTEVMINGADAVYCERHGRLERTRTAFASAEALLSALRNVAQFVGRPFDPEHPVLEGRLPDGSRVQAIVAPAAHDGPCVSIRRFSGATLTLDDLLCSGSLDAATASEIVEAIETKQNVLVAGGTGSGKTSLLNALSALIPSDERVIVIEDSRELKLQREHVVCLEAQPGDPRGHGRVTVRDLFRATLRMRPDRIVIGELRGAEAFELVSAATSGHGGCMSTLHASQPSDALARLETMALMSDVSLPLGALRERIASGIDVIVQVERGRDGKRRVSELAYLHGLRADGGYCLEQRTTAAKERA